MAHPPPSVSERGWCLIRGHPTFGRATEQVGEQGSIPDSPEKMATLSGTHLKQLAKPHHVEPANGHNPPPHCRSGAAPFLGAGER